MSLGSNFGSIGANHLVWVGHTHRNCDTDQSEDEEADLKIRLESE